MLSLGSIAGDAVCDMAMHGSERTPSWPFGVNDAACLYPAHAIAPTTR